jgi:hypothetical protein
MPCAYKLRYLDPVRNKVIESLSPHRRPPPGFVLLRRERLSPEQAAIERARRSAQETGNDYHVLENGVVCTYDDALAFFPDCGIVHTAYPDGRVL